MKNWETTRDIILNTELPVDTKSYSAIPHSVFLEEISEELYKKNYIIAEERLIAIMENIISNNGEFIP